MAEVILGQELSDKLVELCTKYSVSLGNVKGKINENNLNYKEEEKEILEKQIQIDEDHLDLLIKKDTNKHLFKQTIASLIFYKYKLENI
jgi:hypothetical protein